MVAQGDGPQVFFPQALKDCTRLGLGSKKKQWGWLDAMMQPAIPATIIEARKSPTPTQDLAGTNSEVIMW